MTSELAEPLLRVSGIETFYGPIQAIRGISLEVPRRGIVTVLGADRERRAHEGDREQPPRDLQATSPIGERGRLHGPSAV